MGKEQTHLKTIAQNKKAFHDYFVEESFEAGIELCGTEVKSCLLYTSTYALKWTILMITATTARIEREIST